MKKKKTEPSLLFTGVALLFFAVLSLPSKAADNNRPFKIFAPVEISKDLIAITVSVYQNLDFFFGTGSASFENRLDIYYIEQDSPKLPPESPQNLQARLNEDDTYRQAVNKIASMALAQRIIKLQNNNNGSSSLGNINYSWLTAAISHAVTEAMPERNVELRPDFIPLYNIFQNHGFPALKSITTAQVELENELLYEIYAMHCHLLLRILREEPQNQHILSPPATPALELLKSAARREQPDKALLDTIKKIGPENKNPQKWYETHAPQVARRSPAILPIPRIKQELFYALTIEPESEKEKTASDSANENSQEKQEKENNFTKTAEENKNQYPQLHEFDFAPPPLNQNTTVETPASPRKNKSDQSRVSLINFNNREYWNDNPHEAIRRYNHLLWLFHRTPPLLKPSLKSYMKAMIELHKKGPTSNYRSFIIKGDKEISEALKKHKEINRALTEFQKNSPFHRIKINRSLFNLLEEKEERLKKLAPELHRFLDDYSNYKIRR